mmetsp:Transcript_5719/g.6780  ORF Transcript_5719/g.6780 Transcript_5719/m.6780 type:complete len:687 (+) Transcript_5719:82-2142(+)
MSNTDPGSELDMIRSLLHAEQSKDSGQLQEVHHKILSNLSSAGGEEESANMENEANTTNYSTNSSLTMKKRLNSNSSQSQSQVLFQEAKETGSISTFSRNSSRTGTCTGTNNRKHTTDEYAQNSVSRLLRQRRQKNPVVVFESSKVEEVAKILCNHRQNAALVRSTSSGKICGIVTDADICRRLVAQNKSAKTTSVDEIMTPNPLFVNPSTEVLEVFEIMVLNRFRHLPVLDRDGETVYGLVDITQCLYDAIKRIEKIQKSQVEFVRSVQRAHVRWSSSVSDDPGGTAILAQQMIENMMEKIAPAVTKILDNEGKPLLKLSSDRSVLEAAGLMGYHRQTAVLGVASVHEDECNSQPLRLESDFGIFTTKDLLSKVIAKGLNPSNVRLDDVMTRRPDTVEASSSLLDALHIMHDGRFLHVPVSKEGKDNQHSVCGILDVLDCAVHTFSNANVGRDSSSQMSGTAESAPEREMFSKLFLEQGFGFGQEHDEGSVISDSVQANSTLRSRVGSNEIIGLNDSVSQHGFDNCNTTAYSRITGTENGSITIKVKILSNGKMHRISLSPEMNWQVLKSEILSMAKMAASDVSFAYVDEEGDPVTISSDSALKEAQNMCQMHNLGKLTILVTESNGIQSNLEGATTTVGLNTAKLSDTKLLAMAFASGVMLCVGVLFLSSGGSRGRGYHRRNYY